MSRSCIARLAICLISCVEIELIHENQSIQRHRRGKKIAGFLSILQHCSMPKKLCKRNCWALLVP